MTEGRAQALVEYVSYFDNSRNAGASRHCVLLASGHSCDAVWASLGWQSALNFLEAGDWQKPLTIFLNDNGMISYLSLAQINSYYEKIQFASIDLYIMYPFVAGHSGYLCDSLFGRYRMLIGRYHYGQLPATIDDAYDVFELCPQDSIAFNVVLDDEDFDSVEATKPCGAWPCGLRRKSEIIFLGAYRFIIREMRNEGNYTFLFVPPSHDVARLKHNVDNNEHNLRNDKLFEIYSEYEWLDGSKNDELTLLQELDAPHDNFILAANKITKKTGVLSKEDIGFTSVSRNRSEFFKPLCVQIDKAENCYCGALIKKKR